MEVVILDGAAIDGFKLADHRIGVTAKVVINIWLKQYNTVRPHQALNMRPPVPETLRQ
ncbi:MAG TPA: hypothetical protein EYM29_04975, partial [Rhodospirillales bacterium]|nr:hypothetical protein [Rhodospirillales bacterium]HIM76809.1 hypothetical protein [Rhodospirillales bacterium]